MIALETCINSKSGLATETSQISNGCNIAETHPPLSCGSLHKHMGLAG